MLKGFLFLILFFSAATTLAEGGICSYFTDSLKSLNDIPKKKCKEIESSEKCQKFYSELSKTLDAKELGRRKLTCDKSAWDMLVSAATPMPAKGSCQSGLANFALGLVNSAVDVTKSVANSISKTRSCNANPNEKKELIAARLALLPKSMKPPIPSKIMSYDCGDIENWFAFTERQNRIEQTRELLPKIRAKTPLTPEEKETAAYLSPYFYKNSSAVQSINAIASKIMTDVAGAAMCYNSDYQTEIYCEALATAASFVLPMGVGPAMNAMRAARLERLAALTGRKLSQAEIDILAQDALQAAKIKNISGRQELVDKVKDLGDADRIALAEKLLGKKLSQTERDTILQAHELSKDELLAKARLLQGIGLEKDQITLFMRSSLTGKSIEPKTLLAIQNLPDSAGKYRLLASVSESPTEATQLYKKAAETAWDEAGSKVTTAAPAKLNEIELSAAKWGSSTTDATEAAQAKEMVASAASTQLNKTVEKAAAEATAQRVPFSQAQYVQDYLSAVKAQAINNDPAAKFKVEALLQQYKKTNPSWNLKNPYGN